MKIFVKLARAAMVGAALVAAAAAGAQNVQDYPNKPVRVLVGYAPGGATDNLARQLTLVAAEKLGQSMFVENRPGGATVIAAQALISSPADGYTIAIFDPSTVAMNQFLFKKPPYDPAKIVPVTQLTRIPFGIMVLPNHPAKTLKDFVEMAKAKPIAYGSSGAGNPVHLAMELFATRAGLSMTHISYKGGAPAINDLLGGQIPAMMMDLPSAMPFIKAGKIRVLAVTTSRRSEALPDVPTIAESGYPGFDAGSWFAAFVPAGTPEPIIAKLNRALREAVAEPKVTAWIREQSFEVATGTPQQMATLVKNDIAAYGQIIRQIGFTLD